MITCSICIFESTNSGYVHTNAFSFGFVFGDFENASIDMFSLCTAFTKTIRVPFHFDPLIESVFKLMWFHRKGSASNAAFTHKRV